MKYKIVLILMFLPFAIGNSQHSDSLLQYLEIAAKNNPSVMQRLYEYQAALQKSPQAGVLSDPQLSIGVFLSPMELLGGNQVADLRLMQMFPWFGVLRAAKDEMSSMANAKFETFRDAKLQVFYNVQRTWYELYKLQEEIKQTNKNITILQTLERLALIRFKSGVTGSTFSSYNSPGRTQSSVPGASGMQGMGSGSGNPSGSVQPSGMQGSSMDASSNGSSLSDLYRIQIEMGELDNQIALLKSQMNTVIAKFNTYLNRPVKSEILIPDTLLTDTLNMSLMAAFDSVLVNNPMLGMLKYEQQSLEYREKMVSRMGYPMIGLGVNYALINKREMSTSSMNGEDMIMPMITITLPIYRKKYIAMKKEVELSRNAIDQGYKAAANSLQAEYYEAMQFYLDAERRMKLYKNQEMLAERTLNIMIKSFSASGAGLTEILRIRQQTLDYQLKEVEALTDYNIAIAWLKRLIAFSQIQ